MKKQTNNKKISLIVLSFIIFVISYTSVLAACSKTTNLDENGKVCYIALESNAFPGVSAPSGNLGSYLGQVFNFGIAIAVALSLIMIIWGGIEYMTTDAWSGKEAGKARITNALYGLGLALISYLILYTINPTLVTFSGNSFLN